MDAPRQASRHLCHGILAIDADEIGERRKQGGVGEHLRLDAVMQRLFPGVENVSERLPASAPRSPEVRGVRRAVRNLAPLLAAEKSGSVTITPLFRRGRQSELTVNLYDWSD